MITRGDKDILLEALALFTVENVDLVDCMLIATARHGNTPLFSFDTKLNRLFREKK